jgi:hypothetical protein
MCYAPSLASNNPQDRMCVIQNCLTLWVHPKGASLVTGTQTRLAIIKKN